jgi:uncharacterized protein
MAVELQPAVGPVAAGERIDSVDVLRGVALLGILVMNIPYFALPGLGADNPAASGGFSGPDFAAWAVAHAVFDSKMMAIFSMLFGAGLVLMGDRVEARGGSFRGLYYRRVVWLLVIGLVHAYFLWDGDILVSYALCGMLLYPFRRKSPRTLIVLGVLALSVAMLVSVAAGLSLGFVRDQAARAEARLATGRQPTELQRRMRAVWKQVRDEVEPPPSQVAKDLETYRGSYLTVLRERAGNVLYMELVAFPLWIVWRAGGLMLIGMALMKRGVFSAQRSTRFYTLMTVAGYGLGLPIVIVGAVGLVAHRFETVYEYRVGGLFNYVGSVFVALGHVGAVMLVCKAGLATWLTRRLAAVGRMALSNYLAHSVICSLLFYGYGLGLYGGVSRAGLVPIVLAIWAVQLFVSPLWLHHFRFGPAEWLWRSLTYGTPQPMRLGLATSH